MNHHLRILVLSLSTALFAATTLAQACDDPKIIRFALIPRKNAESLVSEFRPLVKVLEESLKRPVQFISTPSYGAVVEGLLAGSVDLAELGPAAYAQAKQRDAGITAFASLIKRVGPSTESSDSYHSLLIVRRNKSINSLASLRGNSVSLIDPASTSGALIPRQLISKLTGAPFERYFGRITFAGSHDRAIQAVQKGFVTAAFVSSSHLEGAIRTGSVRPDELLVLWKSSPIPFDPFVYRGQLCPSVIDKIKQAFFQNKVALHDMLQNMNSEGFTPVSDDKYQEIRDIYANQP